MVSMVVAKITYKELLERIERSKTMLYKKDLIDNNKRLQIDNRYLRKIISEIREEITIYEKQSNYGITNELDNHVFIQRVKKLLERVN